MLDTIAARELDRYAEEKGTLLVDLRTEEAYAAGHIRGAVNAPRGRFGAFRPERTKLLILYCDRGAMSMAVARKLVAEGYRVKSVVGGIRAYRGKNLVRGDE